jgi:hypothetical protein
LKIRQGRWRELRDWPNSPRQLGNEATITRAWFGAGFVIEQQLTEE